MTLLWYIHGACLSCVLTQVLCLNPDCRTSLDLSHTQLYNIVSYSPPSPQLFRDGHLAILLLIPRYKRPKLPDYKSIEVP